MNRRQILGAPLVALASRELLAGRESLPRQPLSSRDTPGGKGTATRWLTICDERGRPAWHVPVFDA